MSNTVFPKLSKPRVASRTFKQLVGLSIPKKSKTNPGNVGIFIDNYIKSHLKINGNTIVDLEDYGIEIKTKDIETNTDWSIGSMTLEDILNTDYENSSICKKMQALLLVDTDDTFRVIKDYGLYYLDFDEAQQLLKDSYDNIRNQLKQHVINHAMKVNAKIQKGIFDAVLDKIEFSSFEKFHGTFGKFEYTNSGTSFMFRITKSEMRELVLKASTHTTNSMFFE